MSYALKFYNRMLEFPELEGGKIFLSLIEELVFPEDGDDASDEYALYLLDILFICPMLDALDVMLIIEGVSEWEPRVIYDNLLGRLFEKYPSKNHMDILFSTVFGPRQMRAVCIFNECIGPYEYEPPVHRKLLFVE